MKTRVIIFTRVSKVIQDYQRQINELLDYSNKQGYEVVRVINEKVSGAKKNEERKGIQELYDLIRSENVNKVLVWELSRLGRSPYQVATVINELNERKISLFIYNYNLETLDNKGDVNPMARFLVAVISEFSSMERDNIKMRLCSGYRKFRDDGGKVGRKIGYKLSDEDLLQKYQDVAKHLKKGISVRNVAKLTGKSSKTVQKVKQLLKPGSIESFVKSVEKGETIIRGCFPTELFKKAKKNE